MFKVTLGPKTYNNMTRHKDATVQAFAAAFNVDPKTAQETIIDLNWDVEGKLTEGTSLLGHKVTEVITAPKKLTKWKLQGEKRERKMRIRTFVKDYTQGTYYILVRDHALLVKDGQVIDPNPKGITEKHIVKVAFRIEPTNDAPSIDPATSSTEYR